MGGTTLRDLLNRLRWGAGGDAGGVAIGYLVRDEGGERLDTVDLAGVVEILPAGVTLSGGTFIPYHRIRGVRRGREELWRPREKRGGDEG